MLLHICWSVDKWHVCHVNTNTVNLTTHERPKGTLCTLKALLKHRVDFVSLCIVKLILHIMVSSLERIILGLWKLYVDLWQRWAAPGGQCPPRTRVVHPWSMTFHGFKAICHKPPLVMSSVFSQLVLGDLGKVYVTNWEVWGLKYTMWALNSLEWHYDNGFSFLWFFGGSFHQTFGPKGKSKLNLLLALLKVHKTETSVLQVPDSTIKEKHDLRLWDSRNESEDSHRGWMELSVTLYVLDI